LFEFIGGESEDGFDIWLDEFLHDLQVAAEFGARHEEAEDSVFVRIEVSQLSHLPLFLIDFSMTGDL
jgi:hypothetical protein